MTGISVPGVQSLAFSYDNADRITGIANGIEGTMTQSFGYDALSRLTSVTSIADNATFQYDANGNRIAQTANGVSAPSTISPTSNRLVSVGGTTYGHDASGNITTVVGSSLGSVITGYVRGLKPMDMATSDLRGGGIGLAIGVAQTSLEAAIRASNDCGCGK